MKMIRKHFEITKEDILAGKYYPQSLIDPLWWSVSIYDGKEQYEKDLAPFTSSQRVIFAVQWYEAEVSNGGHDQFLCNSTGIPWRLCGYNGNQLRLPVDFGGFPLVSPAGSQTFLCKTLRLFCNKRSVLFHICFFLSEIVGNTTVCQFRSLRPPRTGRPPPRAGQRPWQCPSPA